MKNLKTGHAYPVGEPPMVGGEPHPAPWSLGGFQWVVGGVEQLVKILSWPT